MSLDFELSESIPVYRVSYKLWLPDVKGLMSRVAQKANELAVSGYIAYTQCGNCVSGELEGTQEKLALMMSWLQKETPEDNEQPLYGQYQLLLKPGYNEFFCC